MPDIYDRLEVAYAKSTVLKDVAEIFDLWLRLEEDNTNVYGKSCSFLSDAEYPHFCKITDKLSADLKKAISEFYDAISSVDVPDNDISSKQSKEEDKRCANWERRP